MRFTSLALFALTLGAHSFAFGAACPASTTSTGTGSSNGTNCTVTGSASTIQLNFVSGFADATGISAVGGNGGTTVGAQRKLSFIKAAEILADQVQSSQVIEVDADFTSLSCDAFSATLGSAGATTNLAYGSPAPGGLADNTFYPIGLMNAIRGLDENASLSDITAQFNANIGTTGCLQASSGWYYGFDAPPSGYIGFTTVLLHEMTHGLGFASLTNGSTGAKASPGLDDIFSNFLYSAAAGADWKAANTTNTQRANSALSVTGLLWNGSNVNTQAIGLLTAGYQDNDSSTTFTSGDRVQMYAPSSFESGSSVSHFSTAAAPNELMEPQYTEGQMDLGLALYLLKDIGWGITAPSGNTAPTITAVDQSTNEDVALSSVDMSGWASDVDSDPLTFSVTSCPANITCNQSGSSITLTPAANYNGATNTVTVQVSDGKGGTASDSFNLNVVAQPDDPVINSISAQSTNEDVAKEVTLGGSDPDGDSLTYSVTTCPANITCSVSGTSLTLTPAANYNGATNSVTVEVNDGTGRTDSTSFNLAVNAVNDAPVITAVDQSTNEDTAKVVDVSGWGSDIDSGSLTYSVTSCPANVTCAVAGTNLTLTPAANFNGATNTVTVQVSDGSLTASDSFNLNIAAVNDAPTLAGVPDKTLGLAETKTINLASYAADVDGDSLTFSMTTTCSANLTCTLSGSSLDITANSGAGTTESITVQVSDGSLSANDSFDVTIQAAATVTLQATHSGVARSNGDTVNIGLSKAAFTMSGGTAPYSFALTYNSQDKASLLTSTTTSTEVALPSSGAFAGDYTLTITDANSNSMSLTLQRPVRLALSSMAILDGDTQHTLKVEGGASATVYTLVQGGDASLLIRDANGAANAVATAANDAASFNAAVFYLDTHPVTDITSTDISVQSTYDDADLSNIKVYPASEHTFTVSDVAGSAIAGATATLDGGETLLAALNLALTYTADDQGQFTVRLPDTSVLASGEDSFAMTISASGYQSEALTLDSTLVEHDVTLTEMANGITLTGSISALGSQDFKAKPPVVTVNYADGSSEQLIVTVSTVSQASFSHNVDLNQKSLSSMNISQADSLSISLSLSTVQQDQTFNILLERNVAVVTSSPTSIGDSGKKGGSFGWWLLLGLPVLLGSRRRSNK